MKDALNSHKTWRAPGKLDRNWRTAGSLLAGTGVFGLQTVRRRQYAPRVICDVRRWKEASMTSVHAFVWSARAGALALFALCVHAQAQTDPLPSWNEGPSKQAIVEFVKATTDKASPKFVPPEARIATFDQDGTN